jgi:hypothetical protein
VGGVGPKCVRDPVGGVLRLTIRRDGSDQHRGKQCDTASFLDHEWCFSHFSASTTLISELHSLGISARLGHSIVVQCWNIRHQYCSDECQWYFSDE